MEILGHSIGGITYRHYAHRVPLAFRAIMTLPQLTAFQALVKGSGSECPCCRRRYADAGWIGRTHRSEDVSAVPSGQLDGTEANRTRTTLDQHEAGRDRARDLDTAMGRDARDAEAGPLLVGDPVG